MSNYQLIEERAATSLWSNPAIPEGTDCVILQPNLCPSVLELSPDFVQRLGAELSTRKLMAEAGVDSVSALDQFIYKILKEGGLRFLSARERKD